MPPMVFISQKKTTAKRGRTIACPNCRQKSLGKDQHERKEKEYSKKADRGRRGHERACRRPPESKTRKTPTSADKSWEKSLGNTKEKVRKQAYIVCRGNAFRQREKRKGHRALPRSGEGSRVIHFRGKEKGVDLQKRGRTLISEREGEGGTGPDIGPRKGSITS